MSPDEFGQPRLSFIDLAAFDEADEPIPFRACHACSPWYAEAAHDPADGRVMIREWHAAECPHLLGMLEEDAREGRS